MEEIRFISESCKVNDIPEGSGRLFTMFDDEKVLADLIKKVGMTPFIGHGIVIPEGPSEFLLGNTKFIIMNVKGECMQCFPENEHV